MTIRKSAKKITDLCKYFDEQIDKPYRDDSELYECLYNIIYSLAYS